MSPSARNPVLVFLCLALAGCGGTGSEVEQGLDLERRVAEYEDAVNAGDVEATLALMSEDIRWQLPTRKESLGADLIRSSLQMDSAMGVSIEISDCDVSGLVVNCRMTERNDWLALHGLDRWEQPQVRFVFNESGEIRMISWIGRDEETFAELKLIWKAFAQWARADVDREARFMSMVDTKAERLYWDQPTANTLLALGREWVDAGRPGLDELRASYAKEGAAAQEATGDVSGE